MSVRPAASAGTKTAEQAGAESDGKAGEVERLDFQ